MKIRFQADADLNERIVRAVRRRLPAIDFQTAGEGEIRGLDDLEVIAAAASEGRIVITHDRSTMPVHFGNFIATKTSPGLFILPQELEKEVEVVIPAIYLHPLLPSDEAEAYCFR